MSDPEPPPIKAFLSRRVSEGVTAEQIAGTIAGAWRQIGLAMSPVIGQRGAAALYKRSLHLAGTTHRCLAPVNADGLADADLDALKNVLARQSAADAAAAGTSLLLSFHDLVGSLIGPALSAQLLGAVWVKFFSGPAAQDPSP